MAGCSRWPPRPVAVPARLTEPYPHGCCWLARPKQAVRGTAAPRTARSAGIASAALDHVDAAARTAGDHGEPLPVVAEPSRDGSGRLPVNRPPIVGTLTSLVSGRRSR